MKKTSININPSFHPVDYNSRLLFIGSCFSDEVGKKMGESGFETLVNPFGVVFNPVSISDLIKNNVVSRERITTLEDVFLHYDYHSKVHGYSKEDVLDRINELQEAFQSFLTKASHIFITLGTAWVYEYQGRIVNNCHKQNHQNFTKRLLSVSEIKNSLSEIVHYIQEKNDRAKVIFTVSPVRHVKNGLVENSISKARLITAIHELNDMDTEYFPAYEIVMDELRDYAFYDTDGVHLNKIGVDKVFDYFAQTFLSEKTKVVMKQLQSIQTRMNHRPQFEKSLKWLDFKKQLEIDIEKFTSEYPQIRLKK